MITPVKIIALLIACPGKADALRVLLDGMTRLSRAEAGNLRYDLWQDQGDPARFLLDELYVDGDAVVAHRASAHFGHYLSVIGDLAERTAFTLDPIAVV